MEKTLIKKRALINSLATAVYVTAVGMLMSNANTIFGKEDTPLTPVVVLMLLVLSAAITGILLFGQPVMWYLDNKKKPALQLLGLTLGCFLVLTLIAMAALIALK